MKNQFKIVFTENDVRAGKTIKQNLNDALNEKLADVESRRDNKLKRDKRIKKLPDGPERRKLIFQADTEERAMARKKTDYCIQEQEIHESYQLLLKVNTHTAESKTNRSLGSVWSKMSTFREHGA